jgi:hypothetical protein
LRTYPPASRQIDPYAIANLAVTYQFAPGWAVQATNQQHLQHFIRESGIQDADNERFAAQVPQPKRSAFIRLLDEILIQSVQVGLRASEGIVVAYFAYLAGAAAVLPSLSRQKRSAPIGMSMRS